MAAFYYLLTEFLFQVLIVCLNFLPENRSSEVFNHSADDFETVASTVKAENFLVSGVFQPTSVKNSYVTTEFVFRGDCCLYGLALKY